MSPVSSYAAIFSLGRFLITNSISLLVCSNFVFLPVSVLVVYIFLEICPFLTDCPIYCHIIAHNILLLFFFYFCSVGCDFSSLIIDFIYLGPFLGSVLFDQYG